MIKNLILLGRTKTIPGCIDGYFQNNVGFENNKFAIAKTKQNENKDFNRKTTNYSRLSTYYKYMYARRRGQKFALQTWVGHILTWTFLLFTFLLWHSLSSTYFCCTQLSFSQFSPGITQPQLSLTLHNFVTHTSALA